MGAAAGEHAALAPVNNDVQAEQIGDSFLEDAEDVAEAKAKFAAAFEAAAAGGLADLQAPAPVHEVAEVEPVALPPPALSTPLTLPTITFFQAPPTWPATLTTASPLTTGSLTTACQSSSSKESDQERPDWCSLR